MNLIHATHDQVARRAYEIYVANGRRDGHDLDDWLQAEYELLAQPVRVLARMKPQPLHRQAPWCGAIIALVQALV